MAREPSRGTGSRRDASAFIAGDGADGIQLKSARIEAYDRSSIDAFTAAASVAGQVGGGSTAVSVALGVSIAMNEVSNATNAFITGADVDILGTNTIMVDAEPVTYALRMGAYTSGGATFEIAAADLTTPTAVISADSLDDATEQALIEDSSSDDTVVDPVDASGDAAVLGRLRDLMNVKLSVAEQIAGTLKLSNAFGDNWVAATEDGRTFGLRFEGRRSRLRALDDQLAGARRLARGFGRQLDLGRLQRRRRVRRERHHFADQGVRRAFGCERGGRCNHHRRE